ncbi:MAG: metal ABC transporter substrate-binding protein [Nocardioidaceae bacterium]
MRLQLKAPVIAVLLTPLLAACNGAGASETGPRPHVVAAFYPYAYVAQRVLGGHGTVTDLTRPGVEPHDLELTPQEVANISVADIVIYESGFQPSVDAAVAQNPPKQAFDVTTVTPLQDTGAASESDLPGDPHIWQDPTLLIPIVRQFAADAAKAAPAHATAYDANAKTLVRDLLRLDSQFKTGLAHCRRAVFVTSHAAFGYLAKRYGLTMIPIAGLSPDAEPSPNHIAQLQTLIRQDHITTVFSEVLGTKKYADSLAADLGVKASVLDPIEGLSSANSTQNYFSLMRRNLSALQQSNGCT